MATDCIPLLRNCSALNQGRMSMAARRPSMKDLASLSLAR
jgi:hypothetical protein